MPSDSPTHPRLRAGVAGVMAVLSGLAAGHLVAALIAPSASPALAVGSRLIDLTPTPVKEWAVATLGTWDKPVLIGGVLVMTLALGALVGLLALRFRWMIWAGPVALTAIAATAAQTAPAAGPVAFVPALVTGAVGTLVLWWFMRGTGEAADGSAAVYALPRRAFLTGTAVTGVGSAIALLGGQYLVAGRRIPTDVTLPTAAKPLAPLPSGLDVTHIAPWVTPNVDFYRVDVNLIVPSIDVDNWKLSIDGMVDRPYIITWPELLAMPMIEQDITLNCVSNEVGGPYISSARWLGVRVRDLLERAGIQDGVDQILSESTDGMTISTPIEALTDDRDAIIAVAMDGAPLPARHGFPARLVTPGLYGFVGATKWLTRLTATTYAAEQAYWTKRDWLTDGTVKTQARIDTPAGLATQPAGKIAVGGVAWAQRRGITEVEVRVDDGPWQKATLGPDGGTDYWRQWFWVWDATPGRHDLTVRAKDGTGAFQTEQRADPFPGGASGWHSIVVLIS